MIPEDSKTVFNETYSSGIVPSKTYAVDFENKRIIGENDNIYALRDAIFKILNTERYIYDIYDWNYGVEFSDIIGMDRKLATTEIEIRIRDALSVDERIEEISDFEFVEHRNSIEGSFKVKSIWGDLKIFKEVSI